MSKWCDYHPSTQLAETGADEFVWWLWGSAALLELYQRIYDPSWHFRPRNECAISCKERRAESKKSAWSKSPDLEVYEGSVDGRRHSSLTIR